MTRRIQYALILLLLLFVAPAQAQIWPKSMFGPDPSREINVCDAGCDATVICGAPVAVSGGTDCIAGSAYALALAMSPTEANPVTIRVKQGVYREIVAIETINGLNLILESGAILEAFAGSDSTSWGTVDGGALRIAVDPSATTHDIDNVYINCEPGSAIYHHGGSTIPEAAIQIGGQTCSTGNKPEWKNVTIDGCFAAGALEGFSACGGANGDDTPVLTLRNNTFIGGRYGCELKEDIESHGGNNFCVAWSGFCEADETTYGTFLDAVGPVFPADPNNVADATTQFDIDPNDRAGVTRFYNNRWVTLSDNGGAGCGATNACNGHAGVVIAYDDPNGTITMSDACSESITDGCDYTIAAMPHHSQTPCRRADWNVTASEAGLPSGGMAGFAFGNNAGGGTFDIHDLANFHVRTIANDSVSLTNLCQQQSNIAGVLSYFGTAGFNSATLHDFDVEVRANAFLDEGTCASPLAGLAVTGNVKWINGIRFLGGSISLYKELDPDIDIAMIKGNSTQAGTELTVDDVFLHFEDADPNNYTGTFVDLLQASNTTLRVGDIRKNGTIVASGTISGLSKGLTGTATEDIADPAANCTELATPITVTGAAFGDRCDLGISAALPANVDADCYVSAANTVQVRLCGTATVGSLTYTVSVEKK